MNNSQEDQKLSKEQEEAYQQILVRGSAFEQLIRSEGWEYIKKYYQARIQQFANNILLNDKKNIQEFEQERQEIIGIRKLFNMIENDIKILEDDRKKGKNG